LPRLTGSSSIRSADNSLGGDQNGWRLPGFIIVGDTLRNVDPVKVFSPAFLPDKFQETKLTRLRESVLNLKTLMPGKSERCAAFALLSKACSSPAATT
jgi:hypothetical protein